MIDLFVTKPRSQDFAFHYYRNMTAGTLISRDIPFIQDVIEGHRCVWLEWANDLTREITKRKYNAKVVVRVHDHEIYMGRAKEVNWENVDAIWFINRQAMADFAQRIGTPCPMFFLPNAVDTSLYQFNHSYEKKIALNSIFPRQRKRIDRAIELIKEVNRYDPEWELTIRFDPTNYEQEYEKLMKQAHGANVGFAIRQMQMDSYQTNKDDISEFFADKAVTLSTSDHEGFHYAIGEGMACGCRPSVLDWEWGHAKDFWEPFVFPSIRHMAQDIVNTNLGHAPYYREMVEERYSPQVLIPQLNQKLEEIL